MQPEPCRSIARDAAWVSTRHAVRFTSTASAMSSGRIIGSTPSGAIPALLTRIEPAEAPHATFTKSRKLAWSFPSTEAQ